MSDFADGAKKIQKLKSRLKDYGERGLDSSMESVSRTMGHYLEANRSEATGALRNSLTVTEGPLDGSGIFSSRQIYALDYWKYLEFGTGIYTSRGYKAPGGGAPFVPIYEWIVAKGITPDPTGPYETQRELAYAISDSLSKGTEQHKFVRPVWRGPVGKEKVIKTVKKSMEIAIRRTI